MRARESECVNIGFDFLFQRCKRARASLTHFLSLYTDAVFRLNIPRTKNTLLGYLFVSNTRPFSKANASFIRTSAEISITLQRHSLVNINRLNYRCSFVNIIREIYTFIETFISN